MFFWSQKLISNPKSYRFKKSMFHIVLMVLDLEFFWAYLSFTSYNGDETVLSINFNFGSCHTLQTQKFILILYSLRLDYFGEWLPLHLKDCLNTMLKWFIVQMKSLKFHFMLELLKILIKRVFINTFQNSFAFGSI